MPPFFHWPTASLLEAHFFPARYDPRIWNFQGGQVMRHIWILPAFCLLAACGPSDRCEAPPQPKLLAVKDMSREQRADALGVPPERVPTEPVTESPEALSAYNDYVTRHNEALQVGYCVDNEAYKARNMKDEMNTLAQAIMATCKEGAQADTLATVLKYRNCAAGNK
jgi:hypothetical protein